MCIIKQKINLVCAERKSFAGLLLFAVVTCGDLRAFPKTRGNILFIIYWKFKSGVIKAYLQNRQLYCSLICILHPHVCSFFL